MLHERDSPRSRAFLKAHIRYQNKSLTVECIVRNLSLTGARLEVAQDVGLPTEFDLEIPQRGAVMQCAVKWREDDAVGVKFLNSTMPMDARHAPDAELIEGLRHENARLRDEIARLKLRIQELTSEL